MLEDLDQIEARIGVLSKLALQLASERDALLAERTGHLQQIEELEKQVAQSKAQDESSARDREATEQENAQLKAEVEALTQQMGDAQFQAADFRSQADNYREGLMQIRGKVSRVLDNLPAK